MADTATTNLGLTKPEPGASDDTWGIKHNANMDTLDAAIFAKFAKAGGTITGPVSIVHATVTGNNVILRNTSADGYGLFSQGGYGLRYAAQFVDKDESQLMLLSGTGALTVAQGGTFGGHILPANDNSIDCGSNSRAIKQIYSNNSVIVTSDARLKTARPYNTKERAVARRCRDLGVVYQWNDAIAQKGVDRARMHFGTTVQSVIAAFEAEGLDPMRYGVVCYDEWQAEVIEHPAIEAREAVPARPAVYEERMVDVVIRVNGEGRAAQRPALVEVQPAVPAQPAVQAREAWTENVRDAGSRYSLRLDQLAFFIATAGAGA